LQDEARAVGPGDDDVRAAAGDAEHDYYQAERILESHKNLKRTLLGSFNFSAIAYVLGRSAEEHYANALNAVIGLYELADEPSGTGLLG